MDIDTKDRSYTFDYEYRPTQNLTLSSTFINKTRKRHWNWSIDDIKIIASDRSHTWHKEEMNFYDIKSKMHADFEESKKWSKIKS